MIIKRLRMRLSPCFLLLCAPNSSLTVYIERSVMCWLIDGGRSIQLRVGTVEMLSRHHELLLLLLSQYSFYWSIQISRSIVTVSILELLVWWVLRTIEHWLRLLLQLLIQVVLVLRWNSTKTASPSIHYPTSFIVRTLRPPITVISITLLISLLGVRRTLCHYIISICISIGLLF